MSSKPVISRCVRTSDIQSIGFPGEALEILGANFIEPTVINNVATSPAEVIHTLKSSQAPDEITYNAPASQPMELKVHTQILTEGSLILSIDGEPDVHYTQSPTPVEISRTINTGFVMSKSEAGDISDSVWADTYFNPGPQTTNMSHKKYSPNGMKLFLSGNSLVHEYDVSTPFSNDPSHITYTGNTVDISFRSVYFDDIRAFAFKPDGTKLYIAQTNTASQKTLLQYTLGTAFDLTSASFVNEIDLAATTPTPVSIQFDADGSRYWMSNGADLQIYTMSTLWDTNTSTYTGTRVDLAPIFQLSGVNSLGFGGAYMSENGLKVYPSLKNAMIGGGGFTICEGDLSFPFDITTITNTGRYFTSGGPSTIPYAMFAALPHPSNPSKLLLATGGRDQESNAIVDILEIPGGLKGFEGQATIVVQEELDGNVPTINNVDNGNEIIYNNEGY